MIQGAVERLRGDAVTEDPCQNEEEEAEDPFEAEVEKEVRRILVKEEAKRRVDEIQSGALEVPEFISGYDMSLKRSEHMDWLIEGLIPRYGVVGLAAQAKAGKTTFMHKMIEALIKGTDFLGLSTQRVNGGIFLLDMELPEDRLGEWTYRNGIAERNGVYMAALSGRARNLDLSNHKHMERWVETLKAANCKLLIIDPIGPYLRMLGAEENSTTEAGRAIDYLKELQVAAGIDTLIFTHHTGHSETGRARGSSVILDIPDVNANLRIKNDSTVRLFSARGRDVDLDTIAFEYDPDTGTLSMTEGDDNEGLTQDRADDIGELLNILSEAPGLSANRIAQAMAIQPLGCGKKRSAKALAGAVQAGFILAEKQGDHARAAIAHTLTDAGEAELARWRVATGR